MMVLRGSWGGGALVGVANGFQHAGLAAVVALIAPRPRVGAAYVRLTPAGAWQFVPPVGAGRVPAQWPVDPRA